MCSFTVLGGSGGSKNQSVSGVTTICLTQCNTSPSHRVDQVVDCGLWNVGPLLFNGCVKLLDIVRNHKNKIPRCIICQKSEPTVLTNNASWDLVCLGFA